jgi:hypothetical protein
MKKALWVSKIRPDEDTIRKADERGLALEFNPELVPDGVMDDSIQVDCFIAALGKAGVDNIAFPTFSARVVEKLVEHAIFDVTTELKNPAISVYGVTPERLVRVGIFLR